MFGAISHGSPDKPDKPGHEYLSGETTTRTDKDTPLIGCPVVRLSGPSACRKEGDTVSQRESGYERKAFDSYETPSWVTLALIPHLPVIGGAVWEPAAGSGKMLAVLRRAGFDVLGTDIATGTDFLLSCPRNGVSAIITNPPYALATEFIERALSLIPANGFVAMLLRADFDSAKTRRHLFADCPAFAKKVVLTKRIRWIEGSTGSPSFNHCWMIWDRRHRGLPTLAYETGAERLKRPIDLRDETQRDYDEEREHGWSVP